MGRSMRLALALKRLGFPVALDSVSEPDDLGDGEVPFYGTKNHIQVSCECYIACRWDGRILTQGPARRTVAEIVGDARRRRLLPNGAAKNQ